MKNRFYNVIVIRLSITECVEFTNAQQIIKNNPHLFTRQENKSPHSGNYDRNKWLDYRLRLFSQVTKKCLDNQTVCPYQVFLLFDKGDKSFVENNFSYNKHIYTPLYLSPGDHGEQEIYNFLKLHNRLHNISITRMDSDDIVSKNFLHQTNLALTTSKIHKVFPDVAYITDLNIHKPIDFNAHGLPIWTEFYPELKFPVNLYAKDHATAWKKEDYIFSEHAFFTQLIHKWNDVCNGPWKSGEPIAEYLGWGTAQQGIDFLTKEFGENFFSVPDP
jgi:hypothetical protein